MGRETKSFRQTKRSGSADYSAKNYARIQRQGGWNIVNRISNIVRFKKPIDDKR